MVRDVACKSTPESEREIAYVVLAHLKGSVNSIC